MAPSEVFNSMPPVGQYVQESSSAPKASQPIEVKESIPASTMNNGQPDTDVAQFKSKPKKTKKGPIKAVKGFIANIKKVCATIAEYSKGIVKGITTGAVAGSLVYTTGAIINGVKSKSAQKAGQEAIKKIPNKFLGVLVATGALAVNIWNASLNATERQSNIEHRWTGHDK